MDIEYFSEWANANEPPLPLKYGDKGPIKGDWIIKVQKKLGVRQTGLFLDETQEAVINYQRNIMKVSPDGIVGPKTWNSLFPDDKTRDTKTKSQNNELLKGIDVSEAQLPIDWGKAKSNGLSFAYIRSSMGDNRYDASFSNHYSGCRSAGIPCGAYHYYTYSEGKKTQLNNIKKRTAGKKFDLPFALDLEFWGHPKNKLLENGPNKKTKLHGKSQTRLAHCRDEIFYILQGLGRHFGKKPIIYCNPNFFEKVISGYEPLESYKLWISAPSRTWQEIKSQVGSGRLIIHQKAGDFQKAKGKFPGVRGDVDINNAYKFW